MQSRIELLENAGLFIQLDWKNLLIDPYSCAFDTPYRQTPKSLLEDIVEGKGQFHWIDNLLVTHDHPDHFDYRYGCDFLSAHPETTLIAPSSVVYKISEMTKQENVNVMVALEQEVGGFQNISLGNLQIQAMRTVHAGNSSLQTNEHFSYYIKGSSTLMILGDAKPGMQTFSFVKERTDIVIAPYLYATLSSGCKIIREYFHPTQIAFYHMPDPFGEEADLYQAAVQRIKKMQDAGDNVYLMDEIGQEIILTDSCGE